MEERQRPSRNGIHEAHPDWTTLVAQAVDDVSRVLHAEADLLQINLVAALRAQIDYAAAIFAMVAAFICATICALAGLILFLHQSFLQWHGFPWWQAFAVGAFLMFVVGFIIRRFAGQSTTLGHRDT